MIHTFEPSWHVLDRAQATYPQETLEAEPMLHSASIAFALEHGGIITRDILARLIAHGIRTDSWPDLWPVIDTRVHMLMPGMYPAIPGWHGDAFPRSSYEGQPDLNGGDERVLSYVCVVDDGSKCSRTEFLNEAVTLHYDPEHVWRTVHAGVQAAVAGGAETFHVLPGHIYQIGQGQLHRATAAERRGWRMFFRLTMYQSPPSPKIRNQTQVYTTEGGGW